MINRIDWTREGEWYYFSKIGIWRIELHKARKYWVANIKQNKRNKTLKKYMLTIDADADFAKQWIEGEYLTFLESVYCNELVMKND